MWCLLLVAAAWAQQHWILHTPGGGPLDARCPCLTPELCPRMFGDSELDVRHFGHIPICMDSREVRCCGVSFSMETSAARNQVRGSRQEHDVAEQTAASANNTQQTVTKSTPTPQTRPANNTQQAVTKSTPTPQTRPANNTQQTVTKSTQTPQTRPANNPQPNSTGKAAVAGHPHAHSDVLDGYSDSTGVTAEKTNNFNTSPKKPASPANSQQIEPPQRGSITDHSDPIIVFPWNMVAKFDKTVPEVAFLVYNSNNDGNDTNDWDSDKKDYVSLISDLAEMHLFESENEKTHYPTETTTPFSNIGQAFDTNSHKQEKEYLVASGSENKGIQEDIEMQQDTEDGDEIEEGKGRDTDDDGYTVDEVSPSAHGRVLMQDIQNTEPNTPKRSFVSENLKMRISQLAIGDQRPTARRKPATATVRGKQPRHRTGPRTSQLSHSTTAAKKQTAYREETLTNRPRVTTLLPAETIRNHNTELQSYENLPDTPVGRKTARSQPLQRLRSKVKNLTRTDQDTTISHVSKSQNTLSGQVDRNHTQGSTEGTLQPQSSRLQRVSVAYQMQENGSEITSPRMMQIHVKRHSEIMAKLRNEGQQNTNTDLFVTGDNRTQQRREKPAADAKWTGLDDIHTTENGRNGAVQLKRRQEVRRKATGAWRSTFGARTRTRSRTSAFQSRPVHVTTKAEDGEDSIGTTFVQNQHNEKGVAELSSSQSVGVATPPGIALASSPETATSGGRGEISVEGTGFINVIGPIPKGFVDPATTQNVDNVNQRGPLFHLPYNTQPEPFRKQIPKPIVPLISTPRALPETGVTSPNHDVKVFNQPHTQTLEQHHEFRDAGIHTQQKQTQAVAAMSNLPNTSNVSQQQRHPLRQNDLESHFSASQGQSPLTAPTSSLPSMREVAELRQTLLFHSPPSDEPQAHIPMALMHSSHGDQAITAKIVPLPQVTSVQKFLSFPDQQLRKPGKQHESIEFQQSPKHPAESRPAPHSFAVYHQDAARHAAQLEYTRKLREYFQQLLNYNREQPGPRLLHARDSQSATKASDSM